MDTSSRNLIESGWLLKLIVIAIAIYINGCTSPGGASIYVDGECNGLGELGYSSPFSEQDIKDIQALGFHECANHLKGSGDN